MGSDPFDPLEQAKRLLRIWDVWEDCGYPRASAREWDRDEALVSSPFREDSSASFSIGKSARVYYDFGEQQGGDVVDFMMRAHQCGFAEARRRILELANIADTEKADHPLTRAQIRRKAVERRNARAKAVLDSVQSAYERPEINVRFSSWPPAVLSRWVEGRNYLTEHPGKLSELAKRRGWPLEWVTELVDNCLLSLPVKAGYEIEPGAPRGWAFIVEAPVDGDLLPLGYHQFTPYPDPKNPGKMRKAWGFFPNNKEKENPSGYQLVLMELGQTIPAVPFVIGKYVKPREIFILEGQWDAITYFGYIGGFDSIDFDSLVIGMRGVSSQDWILSLWRNSIEGREVTLVPQNDPAGRRWIQRKLDGSAEMPNFRDRLKRIAKKLTVKTIPGEGDDFNDHYRKMMKGAAV